MSAIKRIFDVTAAIGLGLMLCPVLVCICLGLKLTSPGPVLFRQARLGKGGGTFLMNKFRKFPADWGTQGPGVTLHKDSRMTGVGNFLERTKLDELPQLWNILIGEMSFVGPRPESLRFRHLFVGEFASVLDYKPGIFGPNQTKYRNESLMYPADQDPEEFYETVLFPAKAKADLAYFRSASVFSDIGCIVSGVFSIAFSFIVWRKSMRASLFLLVWDMGSLVAAWVVTHWLKYSVVGRAAVRPTVVELFYTGLVLAPVVLLFIFGLARVYRHPVRYFSETDCYRLIGASCAVWILTASIFGAINTSMSSLIVGVACILSAALMIVPRVAYSRFYSAMPWVNSRRDQSPKINVVVCGVNQQSIELSSLLKFGFGKARLAGFIAEDKDQVGREIYGAQVLGEVRDLDVLLKRYKLNQIWISDAVTPKTKLTIQDWCERNEVLSIVLADLPGFQALAEANATPKQLESTVKTDPSTERRKIKSKKTAEVAA